MSEKPQILFVDDDATLRSTWSAVLNCEGFEATTASTVAEALSLITSKHYDALVADLNIGEPGDGFTVVSAMRRVQPEAVTMILTGYPAFQAALRAIHEQVDDFLTKPAEPENLIGRLRENLGRRGHRSAILTQRLPKLIAQNRQGIIDGWYKEVENERELAALELTRDDRIDHLPRVLDELVRPHVAGSDIDPAAREAATEHGITRRKQRYNIPLMLEETRILHRVIADYIQRNLIGIDISNLLPDLIDVENKIHLMQRCSVEAFLQAA